ncbi:MAG: hypothetical protein J6V41_08170 [Kiritimatiellae bacterium]|nr:hypothetical protein [Kiritimatiellia bacterium]
MDILERISQVRKEDYEFTGNVEDTVFIFKGVIGEALAKQPNFAGQAVKIIAAFSETAVKSDFFDVFELDKMKNLLPRLGAKTAILCVPHKDVAGIADTLKKCGVVRILNWSGENIPSDSRFAVLNEEPPCIDSTCL